MDPSATLLFRLAVAFLHLCFTVLVLEPRWALAHFIAVAFFGVLYFRRRLWLRRQRDGVYDGLWYAAAIMLGALASALFFFWVGAGGAGMPLPLAIGVWLCLAVAAYFFYRVMVLHLDDEAADAAVQERCARRVPPFRFN